MLPPSWPGCGTRSRSRCSATGDKRCRSQSGRRHSAAGRARTGNWRSTPGRPRLQLAEELAVALRAHPATYGATVDDSEAAALGVDGAVVPVAAGGVRVKPLFEPHDLPPWWPGRD